MIRVCRLVARGNLENGTRCRRWARHVDVVALLVAVALVFVPTVDAGPPASSGRSKSRASTSAEKGQMLRGTVVKAADGSPVAEATVYLATGRTFNRGERARTDAAGRFELGPVDAGKYSLFAQAGNLISHLQRLESEPVTVKAGEAAAASRLAAGRGMPVPDHGEAGVRRAAHRRRENRFPLARHQTAIPDRC